RDDGHPAPRRRAEVRDLRPGVAAGTGDLGTAGVHEADEGRLAPPRRRLRGSDLPDQLPALSRVRPFLGVPIVLTLLATIGAPAHAGDVEAGKRKAEACGACHGADGNATIPGTPSLAGQPVYFTHWQLIKYRDGPRKDAQISPFAKNLTDTDLAEYAPLPKEPPRPRHARPRRLLRGAASPSPPRHHGSRQGGRGQASRHLPPLRLVPPARSLRPAAGPPPRGAGLRITPAAPPRVQGQDRPRSRRHHDHGRPASPR